MLGSGWGTKTPVAVRSNAIPAMNKVLSACTPKLRQVGYDERPAGAGEGMIRVQGWSGTSVAVRFQAVPESVELCALWKPSKLAVMTSSKGKGLVHEQGRHVCNQGGGGGGLFTSTGAMFTSKWAFICEQLAGPAHSSALVQSHLVTKHQCWHALSTQFDHTQVHEWAQRHLNHR